MWVVAEKVGVKEVEVGMMVPHTAGVTIKEVGMIKGMSWRLLSDTTGTNAQVGHSEVGEAAKVLRYISWGDGGVHLVSKVPALVGWLMSKKAETLTEDEYIRGARKEDRWSSGYLRWCDFIVVKKEKRLLRKNIAVFMWTASTQIKYWFWILHERKM